MRASEDTSEGVRFQAAQGIRQCMPKEMIRGGQSPALRKLNNSQQPDEAPDVKNAAKRSPTTVCNSESAGQMTQICAFSQRARKNCWAPSTLFLWLDGLSFFSVMLSSLRVSCRFAFGAEGWVRTGVAQVAGGWIFSFGAWLLWICGPDSGLSCFFEGGGRRGALRS